VVGDEEGVPTFAPCVDELHFWVTVETSSIFGSPSTASVGEDFCDAQCLRAPILGLDSGMSTLLEIALYPHLILSDFD
jgi:hypothetical protein